MKTRYIVKLACICFLCSVAVQQVRSERKLGIGLVFGEPTGFAWKYRIDHTNAVAGQIGFFPDDRFRIGVDYLWHSYPFEERRLALHYGVGAAFGVGRTDYVIVRPTGDVLRHEDLGFAVRAVLGLTYDIPRSPVDLFIEVAPLLVVSPSSGTGVDVGLGARVYP
jgi:hypothetical protein